MLKILGKIKKNDLTVLKNKNTEFLVKCIKAYNIMINSGGRRNEDAKAIINAFV